MNVWLPRYTGAKTREEPMKKVFIVDLTREEKTELSKLISKGELRARTLNRAHILLSANEGRTDKEISEALHTSPSTVERTRCSFLEGGLEHALNESPRPGGKRKLDGHQEAYVVALACSEPPEGKKRWGMQLFLGRQARGAWGGRGDLR